jgi:hypothetical protein
MLCAGGETLSRLGKKRCLSAALNPRLNRVSPYWAEVGPPYTQARCIELLSSCA